MLEKIVDHYIAEKRAEQVRSHDKFRISDAGRCHLMRFWKRQGKFASDEPDARTQRVFEVGHVFHVWLQDLLQKTGLLLHKEYRVEDMHRIGHIDTIVRVGEALILYDFKTVHSRKFHHRRREGGNGDIHYAMQAYTYAMMVPFAVSDVRVVYISKDDLCIEEVSVLSIDDIATQVYQDWNELLTAWEKQEEPKPNPADWECRYCVYRSLCNYSGGVK